MSIHNDRDADHVKFDVSLPPGIDSFSVDAMNGALINQIYLEKGDRITIRFDNSSAALDSPCRFGDNLANPMRTLALDVNRYYKAVYLPVYSYMDPVSGIIKHTINPCADGAYIFDEPDESEVAPIVNVQQKVGVNLRNVILDWSGEFIIGLKNVDTIPDIDVVVGSSLSNIREQSSSVAYTDVLSGANLDSLQPTEYELVDDWKHRVRNLTMKHVIQTLDNRYELHSTRIPESAEKPRSENYSTITEGAINYHATYCILSPGEDSLLGATFGEYNTVKYNGVHDFNVLHGVASERSDSVVKTNFVMKMTKHLVQTCFLPMKANHRRFKFPDFEGNTGWINVVDVDEIDTRILSDRNSVFYLATGHKTLTVKEQGTSSGRWYTFNGNMFIDKASGRKVTVLSNDSSSILVQYMQDILAAKLSRYYVIADVRIHNTFAGRPVVPTRVLIQNFLNNYTQKGNVYVPEPSYCGKHELIFQSCQDMTKLVVSFDSDMKYMAPMIAPTEHMMYCKIVTKADCYKYGDDSIPAKNIEFKSFKYKTMTIHTTASLYEPSAGLSWNDDEDGSTTCGGISLYRASLQTDNDNNTCLTPIKFITDGADMDDVDYNMIELGFGPADTVNISTRYPSNYANGEYHATDNLPCYRIYNNMVVSQNDLSISTGGNRSIKYVSVISVPNLGRNNLAVLINGLINNTGGTMGLRDGGLAYTYLMRHNVDVGFGNVWEAINRFNMRVIIAGGTNYLMSASFDALWTIDNIGDANMNSEAPTNAKPTVHGAAISAQLGVDLEYIRDNNGRVTGTMQNPLHIISSGIQTYNNVFELAEPTLKLLYASSDDNSQNSAAMHQIIFRSLINGFNSFNTRRSYMFHVNRIGLFNDTPAMMYLCGASGNQSTVSNIHDAETRTTHVNVCFKCHQFSKGMQQMTNEMPLQLVPKNTIFSLELKDDLGRLIPNTDTSQGYENNLMLDITLYPKQEKDMSGVEQKKWSRNTFIRDKIDKKEQQRQYVIQQNMLAAQQQAAMNKQMSRAKINRRKQPIRKQKQEQ
jgi:hypothetical protein